MEAAGYFYLALLILVLIPIVILPWEGKSTPDWLYMLLAGSGLAGAAVVGGVSGLMLSCAAGLGFLGLASLMVTALRKRTRARILTGGQIKLIGAGATWLGIHGALAMVVVAAVALVVLVAIQRTGAVRQRPDASAVLAVAILSVAVQQHLPGM